MVIGFRHIHYVDYLDSFDPVVKPASIRIIVALAAIMDLSLFRIDFYTALLNADLADESYMEQPEEYYVKYPSV